MNKWIEEVRAFQEIFECKFDKQTDLIDLRKQLVQEETNEFMDAIYVLLAIQWLKEQGESCYAEEEKKCRIALLDAIADSIIVLIGTANALNLNLDVAMERVFESNCTKLNSDGRPFYNAHGKVMKGPNFKAPELEDLI